jgi:hypothetical protein
MVAERLMIALPVLLLLAQTPVWDAEVFSNPAPWRSLETGVVSLDERAVAGSAYSEYRASTTTSSSVDTLCLAIFESGTRGSDSPGLKASRVLRDGEDERVIYQQIEQAVVSARDYAMTVVRKRLGEGRCGVRFKATNELAPALAKGVVRLSGLFGSWTFEPKPDGKTKVTYTMFIDLAGSVPPFLVHGSLKAAVKESLAKGLQKAHALEKPGAAR